MTVVNPDSIAGITSVTSSGTTLEFYDVNGNLLDVSANLTGELTVGTGATISSPGASIIDFETNGSERLRIGSSGQLGIAGANYGTSGQVLTSAGSGSAVSWTTIPTQVTIANNSNDRIITGGSGTNLNGEANLTFDSSNRLITKQTNSDVGLVVRNTTHDSQFRIEAQAANKNSVIMFADGTDGDVGMIDYDHNDNSLSFTVNTSERLRINSGGQLLIGTTTAPAYTNRRLTVYDSTNSGTCSLEIRGSSSGDSRLYFTSSTTSGQLGAYAGKVYYGHADNVMAFYTAGGERLRIDANGSTGINITNPGSYDPNAESLVVGEISGGDGHAGITIVSGATDKQGSLYFADGTASASYRGRIEYKHASDALCLGTAGSGDKLVIDSSGNVIIRGSNCNNSSVSGQVLQIQGTTRPTLILRGNASGGNTCEIQFADNSGTDSDPGTRVGLIKYEHAGTYANHMHFHTNETERMVISHQGRVGISQSPAQLAGFAEQLQVTGLYGNNYAAAFKIEQSSGSLMRFATTVSGSYNLCGGITVNGSSTSFNTSSDYRLKENDVKISDGITRLKQLRPIRFNWKSDSSTTEDGFFAHEVSPVVPESVSGEKDATIDAIGEGYQKIDHSKLVPLLTAALQESITKIESLESKVESLESKVESLESKVESIEAQQANDAAYEAKIDKIIDYFKL